ncbi:hypothetical protein [Microvirga sp. VF16]|uniref:hypothetical protein n=1 Tax=Microvirga sp. VF16 TaxID=2807101 RepID=UPI00193DD8A7|nr:hypothetical protein [Microvirga sp. VF16]QRM32459.1 hypothetical protein JO965_30655 [Microvirga sp. VF16]
MPASHGRQKDDREWSRSAATINQRGGTGMTLIDLADGVTVDEIKAGAHAEFKVELNGKPSDAALWRLQ